MQFELLTVTGPRFQGEIDEVSVMTTAGQIAILPHHEPLTSVVAPGAISVTPKNGKAELFVTFGGLLEVTAEHVRILTDEAEPADDLIESEIKAAIAEAERLIASAKDAPQLAHANRMLDRSSVRLGVARLKRHNRRHTMPNQ
jgi:F-type H+-transporting ATPase subunit epsilon